MRKKLAKTELLALKTRFFLHISSQEMLVRRGEYTGVSCQTPPLVTSPLLRARGKISGKWSQTPPSRARPGRRPGQKNLRREAPKSSFGPLFSARSAEIIFRTPSFRREAPKRLLDPFSRRGARRKIFRHFLARGAKKKQKKF